MIHPNHVFQDFDDGFKAKPGVNSSDDDDDDDDIYSDSD